MAYHAPLVGVAVQLTVILPLPTLRLMLPGGSGAAALAGCAPSSAIRAAASNAAAARLSASRRVCVRIALPLPCFVTRKRGVHYDSGIKGKMW